MKNVNLIIDKSDLSYDLWFFFNIILILFIVFAVIYIPYILYKNNKLLKEIDNISSQYSSRFKTTELITTYESIVEEIKCRITRIIERENQ